MNNDTKPLNFYFNEESKDYRACYFLCASCNFEGDENENNCTLCEKEFIFNPDSIYLSNCIKKCEYFYYYNDSKYTCTSQPICPEDYNLLIEEKEKCVDKCYKDDIYQYQYKGKCFKECPNNTQIDYKDYLCKDKDLYNCDISQEDLISLNEYTIEEEVEKLARQYAKDFYFANNHISIYSNSNYSIIFYKNGYCLEKINLELQNKILNECYELVKKENVFIDDNLIISIITQKTEGKEYPEIISFSMYEPKEGIKLSSDICNNITLIINEDLISKINGRISNSNSLLFLANQNIDIFNCSESFYNDICYHFDSPINKDIALKDRLLYFLPDIILCENGCQSKGVNLTSLKSICECTINNILNSNKLENNKIQITKKIVEKIDYNTEITNIEIVKCYKDLFNKKYLFSNLGAFIILIFLFIDIILTIIYYRKDVFNFTKSIFYITKQYIQFIAFNSIDCKIKNRKSLDILNINKFKTNSGKKKRKRKRKIKNKQKIAKKDGNIIIHVRKKKGTTSKKINKGNNESILNNDENSGRQFLVKNLPINDKFIIMKNSFDKNNHFLSTETNEENINIKEYITTDFNDMDYNKAIQNDKRNFYEIFKEKIIYNQNILNTFYFNDHMRPRTIKIMLYILEIIFYSFINGLFFNEKYISEIFHSKKEERFFTFIPRSINRLVYTSLIGVIIGFILGLFFVNIRKIKGIFKKEKNDILFLKYEITKTIKNVKIRNNIFIATSFISNILIWYYVFCFNNIYPHMRNEWIKSNIIIILIMQIFYFFICLLKAICRYMSIKSRCQLLYKINHLFS